MAGDWLCLPDLFSDHIPVGVLSNLVTLTGYVPGLPPDSTIDVKRYFNDDDIAIISQQTS